ncbi:MAG TPA: Spy/CpxP family protein refolding chaperone [Burkholderiaceae bacterium]
MTARRARWATLVALFAAVTAALAQDPGRRGGPPGPEEADRGAIQRGTLAGEFSAHLQEVKQRLKLQAAQQAAWESFARRVQALMEDQMRGVARPDDREDAMHQINRRVDVVRNRLAAMEDIADAAGQLYSMLSPDQRKIADELLPTAVPTLYSGLADFPRGPPGGQGMIRKKGP